MAEWKLVEEYSGRATARAKQCDDCGMKFKTMNEAIQHVVKEHPIQEKRVCGDLTILKIARKPYSSRDRTLTTETVIFYRDEPIAEAPSWQGTTWADGAAWGLAQRENQ